jgi:hypothetical protein
MAVIVAARFETDSDVEAAKAALRGAGFGEQELHAFFVGPAGRHDLFPLGGDAQHDEGTKKSGRAAVVGGFIGACFGLAFAPLTNLVLPGYWLPALIAGPAVGAYVGSLVGALRAARGGRSRPASKEVPVEDSGGMTLAVNAGRPFGPAIAHAALKNNGGRSIVQTEGEWTKDGWQDFDPRIPLHRLGAKG